MLTHSSQLDIQASDKCKCACLKINVGRVDNAAVLKKWGCGLSHRNRILWLGVSAILVFNSGSWQDSSDKNKKTPKQRSCGSKPLEDVWKQSCKSGHAPEIHLFRPSSQHIPKCR